MTAFSLRIRAAFKFAAPFFLSLTLFFVFLLLPKYSAVESSSTDDILVGSHGPEEGELFASVDLSFPADYIRISTKLTPERVLSGEAFVLETYFSGIRIAQVTPMDTSVVQEPEIETNLVGARVSLEIASAEVRPLGQQEILDDLLTAWSIYFSHSGRHSGIITIHSDRLKNGQLRGNVRIDVSERRTIFSWMAALGTVLGILIGLTKLIQFIWKWRSRDHYLND